MKKYSKIASMALGLCLVSSAALATHTKPFTKMDNYFENCDQVGEAKLMAKSALQPLQKTTGKTMKYAGHEAKVIRDVAQDAHNQVDQAQSVQDVKCAMDNFKQTVGQHVDFNNFEQRYYLAYVNYPTMTFYPTCDYSGYSYCTGGYDGVLWPLGYVFGQMDNGWNFQRENQKLENWMNRRKAKFFNKYYAKEFAKATFNTYAYNVYGCGQPLPTYCTAFGCPTYVAPTCLVPTVTYF